MNFMTAPKFFEFLVILSSGAVPLSLWGQAGDIDTAFNPQVVGEVNCIMVQPDLRIVIGGRFTMVGGLPRNRIARLNLDGSLDLNFDPNCNERVYASAVQSDGGIVIVGLFNQVAGATRNYIARLFPNGELDADFDPDANGEARTISVQQDGKLIIGGNFTSVSGQIHNRIVRLFPNGLVDPTFQSNANDYVHGTAIQPDGKILLGGLFTQVNSISRSRIARLNPDGSLDESFDPRAGGEVYCIAVQPDGKIVLGGHFTSMAGVARNRIARVNAAGSLDVGFAPGADSFVYSSALQTDGRIVISGYFTEVNGIPRGRIARLEPDGTLDLSFDPSASGWVFAGAIQADGRICVGGTFTGLGLTAQSFLGRILNDSSSQNLIVTNTGESFWQRNGSGQEVTFVSFDFSDNGGNSWEPLGSGNRTVGGWRIQGLHLPSAGRVRCRSHAPSGRYNGSVGLLEAIVEYNSNTSLPSWRQFFFGNSANSGDGADLNDYEGDGIPNLAEYAMGLNPRLSSAGQLPQGQMVGSSFVMSFIQPAGVTGVTYGAEWSATMLPTDWHPVVDTGVSPQHVFSVPVGTSTGVFMRLVVTSG